MARERNQPGKNSVSKRYKFFSFFFLFLQYTKYPKNKLGKSGLREKTENERFTFLCRLKLSSKVQILLFHVVVMQSSAKLCAKMRAERDIVHGLVPQK